MLRAGRGRPSGLRGTDDHAPVGILALAGGGDARDLRDRAVHDLSFERVHGVEALGPAGLLYAAGRLAGSGDELVATPLAVVLHVDHDLAAFARAIVDH